MGAEFLEAITRFMFALPRPRLRDGSVNPEYDEEVRMWRIKMAGGVSLSLICNAALISVLYGVLGGGFARAEETREILAEQIASKIEKAETTLCMADDGTADPQIMVYRRELQEKYRAAVGHFYDVPACSLLLKIRQ